MFVHQPDQVHMEHNQTESADSLSRGHMVASMLERKKSKGGQYKKLIENRWLYFID